MRDLLEAGVDVDPVRDRFAAGRVDREGREGNHNRRGSQRPSGPTSPPGGDVNCSTGSAEMTPYPGCEVGGWRPFEGGAQSGQFLFELKHQAAPRTWRASAPGTRSRLVLELEQELTALGAALEWPPTPNLAPRIGSHLRAPSGAIHVPTGWGGRSRWALAAAAVVIALAALAIYPPSREAIANWVNVHTSFQQVPHLATPSPQPPGPLGQRLGLGGMTTVPDAQKQLTWHITVPSSLGQPDEVYLQPAPDAPALGEITPVYATRPGIPVAGQTGVSVLITEARGAVDQNFFGKMIGPGTTPVSYTHLRA